MTTEDKNKGDKKNEKKPIPREQESNFEKDNQNEYPGKPGDDFMHDDMDETPGSTDETNRGVNPNEEDDVDYENLFMM